MGEAIVSMTQAARSRARYLLDTQGQGAEGIKLSVKPTGCSGYSYMMDSRTRSRRATRSSTLMVFGWWSIPRP
ncbi:MAG: hypothetical protein R3C97_13935 [Geminicoccaceae bacterium]